MATDTQSGSTNFWTIILTVAAAIFLVWAFVAAQNAGARAEANERRILVPELDLHFVAGAPARFAGAFEEAVEDADQDVQPDDYLWTTIIAANQGLGEAQSVTATVSLGEGAEPVVLGNLDGFGSLAVERDGQTLELGFGDMDAGETSYAFLGFDPAELPDGLADDWADAYTKTVSTIELASDDAEVVYYGGFLAGAAQ